jgi:methylenetetrahydrofolate dehydrogenase (NADP+)/methenyltetrahydrofolate cyclohydrolase
MKAIQEAGMEVELINLPEDCTTLDVIDAIFKADLRVDCTAIMVQLPLPEHIDTERVLKNIPIFSDIDGLNPHSVYKPLTPCAIMRYFKENNISLEGKNVVILGRSNLVGKPLADMMIEAGATVTVMNSKTPRDVKERLCLSADIIVSAVGKPSVVNLSCISWVNKQIIIDVGINRDENGKLCGDVSRNAYQMVTDNGGYCSPVPGGVGKWTVRELVLRLQEMEKQE